MAGAGYDGTASGGTNLRYSGVRPTLNPPEEGGYGLAALALALAGRFAAQPRLPDTAGTLPSDTATFGALVYGVILLVGALCFFPALALGPLLEFYQH